ncbi:MAG: hypothetical protein AAGI30_12925 [Planctomycetota bacterium]
MSTPILCAAVSSAAAVALAPSASAVPIEIIYSGTVSQTDFTGSTLVNAAVSEEASLTLSFDTSQQGAVFGNGGSLYDGPLAYSYDIGGGTESGTSGAFLRFTSQPTNYGVGPLAVDINPGGGHFLTTITLTATGTTLNPFGVTTSNIEDVAGTYDASQFGTTDFFIVSFNPSFVGESLTVDLETVTIRVVPAPGAAAAFSLGGLTLLRRRR